jgi:hypothetical protein
MGSKVSGSTAGGMCGKVKEPESVHFSVQFSAEGGNAPCVAKRLTVSGTACCLRIAVCTPATRMLPSSTGHP